MGPEQRHIPTRTCVICRNRREKDVLFRIVRTPEGDIVLTRPGNLMVEELMFAKMTPTGMMMFTEVNYKQLLK